MKIADKIDRELNDTFTENMLAHTRSIFPDIMIESEYSIIDMRKHTYWECEDSRTNERIKDIIEAYERAYSDARDVVGKFR